MFCKSYKWHFYRLFMIFIDVCQVGPDWFCMCVTYSLIFVPSILFIIYIADAVSIVLTILSVISLAVLLALFSYAACSDPGIVYRDPDDLGRDMESRGGDDLGIHTTYRKYSNVAVIECSQCNMMRPCTAMHCYECGVCVEEVSVSSRCDWAPLFYILLLHCAIYLIY